MFVHHGIYCDRLDAVIQKIKQHPELWCQSNWGLVKKWYRPECRTPYCLAGHAYEHATGNLPILDDQLTHYVLADFVRGYLDLSHAEALYLFDNTRTLSDFIAFSLLRRERGHLSDRDVEVLLPRSPQRYTSVDLLT